LSCTYVLNCNRGNNKHSYDDDDDDDHSNWYHSKVWVRFPICLP